MTSRARRASGLAASDAPASRRRVDGSGALPVTPNDTALALAQGRGATDQISTLATIAREDHDLVGKPSTQWFLKGQYEEVSSMAALLKTGVRARRAAVDRSRNASAALADPLHSRP